MSFTHVAIAVVEQDDQFLIGQRTAGAALGGYWEFPGGKLEHGETPEQCAQRECLEETGLQVDLIRLHSQRQFAYEHGAVHLYFFLCRPIRPMPEPRAPYRWVRRCELIDYEFPPANAELLRSLTATESSADFSSPSAH